MSEKKICAFCDAEIENDDYQVLGDDSIVCSSCFNEVCAQCAICGKYFIEDSMNTLDDDESSLVCEDCYEYNTEECGLCGGHFPKDDMESWGDDMRLCPACFAEEFPDVDEAANIAETTPAYEAMKKRLIGLKVENMADETFEYDSEMDEYSYRYTFSVDIDEDGRICDISRLSKTRCQAIWATGEKWHVCEIYPDDYGEDGFVEDIIRTSLDIVDED